MEVVTTKDELSLLIQKNMNVPTTIEDYVNAGKGIIRTTQCYQALLAYYALKVCEIKHGGYSKGVYTIKQYAEDIGMSAKTLQNWTLIYRRVFEHLDIEPEKATKKDWQVATRVAYLEESDNRVDNIENGTPRKRAGYKPVKIGRTSADIKKAFEANFVENFEYEIVGWNSTVLQMNNKLQKRDLSLANAKVLMEFMETLDEMSDFVNDYLTRTKKER